MEIVISNNGLDDALRIKTLAENGKSNGRSGRMGRHRVPEQTGAPLSIIEHERRDQLRLCDSLELIADQLPEVVDHCLWASVDEKLHFNLPAYHRNEEALFECIGRRAPSWMEVPFVLDRIRHEHAMHVCYADELHENLNLRRAGDGIHNPEMIGYMLRYFFETMRQHLVWEDLTIMPMASRYLTSDDLDNLSGTLVESHKGLRLDTL